MHKSNLPNTAILGIIIGILLQFIAIIIGVLPVLLSLDLMQWGFGIIAIAVFFFIIGLITMIMYIYRYLRFNSVVNGKDLLAHWKYSQVDYENKIQTDFKDNISRNKILLGIVWFFFIIIIAIFVGIGISEGEEDSMVGFVGLMVSILLIISFFAIVMPFVAKFNAHRASPETIITKTGMYHMGQLHTWGKPLAFIDSIKISPDNQHLIFSIKYLTKLGWYKYESYQVEILIPKGELENAQSIINRLS